MIKGGPDNDQGAGWIFILFGPGPAPSGADAIARELVTDQREAQIKLRPMLLLFALTCAARAPLRASWSATDGFSDSAFITFDRARYDGMVRDMSRTPVFAEAIQRALRGREGELTVLDIGTGPDALLALVAARAGAKKVYAVEAVPEVARAARQAVKRATDVPPGVVEVFEGFSTDLTFPEPADLVVAEIVGSIASSEGIYATMHDVQTRLLRAPHAPSSYIPLIVETLAAPMCYALHHPELGPTNFDWEAVRVNEPPPRFSCSSRAVHALCAPQRLERMRFSDPLPAPGSQIESTLAFKLSSERMRAVEADCAAELARAGAPENFCARVASDVAHSVSGVGMWPRLVLDEAETLVVESRGADGRARRSHWQTALPLLCAAPERVAPGDVLHVDAKIALGRSVADPVQYDLRARVETCPKAATTSVAESSSESEQTGIDQ